MMKLIHKRFMLVNMLFIIMIFVSGCYEAKNKVVHLNKNVYTLKTYSGLFFQVGSEKKYIGGTETRSGSDCQVYVYNRTKNVIEDSFIIKGSTSVWSFYQSDDVIYFGSIDGAALYSYDIHLKEVNKLLSLDEDGIYNITGDDNNLYIATAGNANLYTYNLKNQSLLSMDLVSDQNFVRSLTYIKNKCYLGMGSRAEFIEYDLQNHTSKNILPKEYEENSFVYDQVLVGDKILLFLSPSYSVLLFDTVTETFKVLTDNIRNMTIEDANNENRILINAFGYLFDYDVSNQNLTRLDNKSLYVVNTESNSLEGVTREGIYQCYDRSTLITEADFYDELNKTPVIPVEFLAYNDTLYVPDRRFTVLNLSNDNTRIFRISSEPQASITSSKGVFTVNYTEANIWFYPYDVLHNMPIDMVNLDDRKEYMCFLSTAFPSNQHENSPFSEREFPAFKQDDLSFG